MAIARELAPANLGPAIEYYLPSERGGPVILEILDAKGAVINSYNSETPANTVAVDAVAAARWRRCSQDDPDAPPATTIWTTATARDEERRA